MLWLHLMPNLSIVFDLDDTLYLERDYVWSGFRAVGQWLQITKGVNGFTSCAWDLFQSGARVDIFQSALRKMGREEILDCVGVMLDVYRNHLPEIRLPPDAEYCLAELKGSPTGLITDGRAEGQSLKCSALGLHDLLPHIVRTGVWGEEFYKPHPRAFEFMEERLGKQRSLLVYVADNPKKDFGAPLARGWKTVRIRRPGGLHAECEALSSLQPHIELPDLWKLPEAIQLLV